VRRIGRNVEKPSLGDLKQEIAYSLEMNRRPRGLVRAAFLASTLIGLSACGDVKDECLVQHPVRSPDDLKGDQIFSGCAVAPNQSQPPPPCDASTAAATERDCASAGRPCAGSLAVSREAALCVVAKRTTLTGLVRGPFLELGYHAKHGLPVWNVYTVTSSHPSDGEGGGMFTVSALDGAFLEQFGWRAIP
jgi:hypothetical protein